MKRILSFILMFILILNTVITPELFVRAQTAASDTATRTAVMRRADKILGLEEYDEYGISDSDADIYDYQMNLKYPAAYLVEAAEKRFGFTDLMTVVNKFNNEDFRLHPEYYYEAALMSLLFEQAGDSAFLESNEQDVLTESSQVAGSLLGYAAGQEADALESLKNKDPKAFTEQEYLNSLDGIKKIENGATILNVILGYATDAADVILYAKNLEKILDLQEETITFLTEMKNRTDDTNIKKAMDTVLSVYRQNQERPEDLINFIIQMESTSMAFEKLAWTALEMTWDAICASVPVLQVVNLALGIEGFVLEYTFATDAISDAYAKMEAIYQLENIARKTVKDFGKEYINDRAVNTNEIEDLAEVFNVGWDFFTVLLDADCQASLLFAKATFNAGVADLDIWALFSGSGGYDEFAGYIKNYQGTIARWKNNINLYMEGLKPENRKVDGATFRKRSVELDPGDTYFLDMDLLPEDAADKYVRYGIVSEDRPSGDTGLVVSNDIVKIEGNKLTALLPGEVQIEGIAGDSGQRDVMTINIAMGGVSAKGLRFRVEDEKAIITGYEGTDTKVIVDDYIQGIGSMAMFPVIGIESFVDEDGKNDTAQEIVLSSSVTEIGDRAFYQCSSLETINLENVEKLGDFSFAECSSIKNVKLANVSEIGDAAFMRCSKLEEVTLKNKNDTVIGSSVFTDCSSLRKVDLSESALRIIPQNFCSGCNKLKKVVWPENLEGIREGGFYNCGFEEMVLPDRIKFLGPSSISGCKNLKILVLPASINNMMESPLIYENSEDTLYYVEKGSYVHNLFREWINEGYSFYIRMMKHLSTEKTVYTVSVGDTLIIPYQKKPILSDEVITFESSDSSIASITPDGKLTGLMPGTVALTLTSSYGQVFSNCKVTVTESSGTGKGQNNSQSLMESGSSSSSASGKSSSIGKNSQTAIKASTIKKANKSKKVKMATVGKPVRLKVRLSPSNATVKPVWSSSKPKVATVSQDGTVIPKKKGKATITARIANGKKVTWKIKVKTLKAKKIRLNKKKAVLHVGETLKLKTKLNPKGATAKIKWKSSKKKVAAVSKKGKITAKKKGKAVITAQLPNGKKATCKITVKKAVPQRSDSGNSNTNDSKGNTGGSIGQNNSSGTGSGNTISGSGGNSGTQPGGGTGVPDSGSGTSDDNSNPGDNDQNPGDALNPGGDENPGGESSDNENIPTKLVLATDTLTLKGRWQTITLSAKEETEANVGEELQITAEPASFYGDSQILDAEITEGNDMQRIHWSFADETIVKVYNGGLVRGVCTGTTTVTATTTDGTTAQCQVTVKDADLQWESSDTEVAEVSSVENDGRTAHIIARKEGMTDITVLSGSYQSVCHLTVSDNSSESTGPTDNTESTGPTEPTDNTESTGPTEPTDSTEPTGPTKPTDSTESTEPTDPSDSNVTEQQPIDTVEDLKAIVNDLDGDYILTSDLDLSGEAWTPIGTKEEPFTGTLDGGGHTISGLRIEEDSFTGTGSQFYGIFGMADGGRNLDNLVEFRHLTVQGKIILKETAEDETIKYRNIYVGGFAGDVKNGVRFTDCISKVDITVNIEQTENRTTTIWAGGFNGGSNENNIHTFFTKCSNEGSLKVQIHGGMSADVNMGGFLGQGGVDVNFSDCQNNGNIDADVRTQESAGVYLGGIVGNLLITNDLIRCENHGNVTAYADVEADSGVTAGGSSVAGGLIGLSGKNIQITDSVNTGVITAEALNPLVNVKFGEIQGAIR